MRSITAAEYATAKDALAVYQAFCIPYVQRNGWTVIPASAQRPEFNGLPLTSDRINAYSTQVELFELARDNPAKFSAYVVEKNALTHVTTWTGEQIGHVHYAGPWHRNNFGGRWRQITIRAAFGGGYSGREYDSRQLVNFRRIKSA